MSRSTSMRRMVIVGGGATGCIAAMNALRLAPDGWEVCIVEKRTEIGRGLAYSTREPDHRLNVRASNMGVFADDPGHFAKWLSAQGIREDDFDHFYAPRGVYGDYVAHTLDVTAQEHGRLRVVSGTAVSIAERTGHVEIGLADGSSLTADTVVLATGHEEGAAADKPYATRLGSPQDTGLKPDAPVMILGTGLSMADVWLTLTRKGHRGPVIALSRRGLMPLGHEGHQPIKLDRTNVPMGTGLTDFVRWFRALVAQAEEAGRDWRDVVDGLRPFNQEIWRKWPTDAKRRFFEHTKPWWDIHRHRMAPEIRQKVYSAKEDGLLRVLAARVKDMEAGGRHAWAVHFQHRHSGKTETVEVDRIYDCQGIVNDVSTGTNPMIRSMIASGSARPDLLRIGLDVAENCAVLDGQGEASARVFAVGPPTRGTFLEIDAIPDIRVQARALMSRIFDSQTPS